VQSLGMEAVTRMTVPQQTDVLASAAAGDEVAFRRIIVENHEDMRRVCQAISGDHAIADEAVQAAWLVAWKKLGKVHGPDQLRPWLVSVAVNEARQLLRKRRRRAQLEVVADASREPGGIDPATGVAAVDLRAALSRLDPDDAALLAMRYVAGFDSNELSAATGISPSGTRSRIERLLRRLREDLGDA
jgi:RNA polymerase sigma-70 factor, ECF subfamily